MTRAYKLTCGYAGCTRKARRGIESSTVMPGGYPGRVTHTFCTRVHQMLWESARGIDMLMAAATWPTPYQKHREAYERTGDLSELAEMLAHVH